METGRQARLALQATEAVPAELVPSDVVAAVASLQPALDRLRRGEWRLIVTGCASAGDRAAAARFSARLLDLADALNARR